MYRVCSQSNVSHEKGSKPLHIASACASHRARWWWSCYLLSPCKTCADGKCSNNRLLNGLRPHVAGSKIKASSIVHMAWELVAILAGYRYTDASWQFGISHNLQPLKYTNPVHPLPEALADSFFHRAGGYGFGPFCHQAAGPRVLAGERWYWAGLGSSFE
jgi:hypothetical protein